MRTPTHILARLALWPLSCLYLGAVRLRAATYRYGWVRAERAPVPVISVGNLSVGGTGKTPLVETICRLLDQAGMRTAVVSRGYRRRGGDAITVVSRGDGKGPEVDVATAGDEPFLLAQMLPRTPVLVSADRVAGARAAARDLGAEVVIADDAFQHLRLARDIDLLTIDATNPTEAGWLLPSGALREPIDASRRASAFLLTHCDRIGETAQLEAIFRSHNRTAPFFRTTFRPAELALPDGSTADPRDLHDQTVVAFCGIGRPEFFRQDLERLGARVKAFFTFPDHHWFEDSDLRRVEERARAVGSTVVLTTEKDYVRLGERQRASLPILRLRIRAELWEERRLIKFLLSRLEREVAA